MQKELTFNELSAANKQRNDTSYKHLDWTENDWGVAICGEVGEMCNFLKKMRRGDEIPPDAIAKEMADVVTYIDLLAQKMGINLGEAIRNKFNEVSLRIGSEVNL